LGAE
jgi:hypothetical protein